VSRESLKLSSPADGRVARLRVALFVCTLLVCLAAPARAQVCVGNPGRDGPGGTLGGIVNTYYPGVGTANAGATGIQLGTPRGAATSVAVGDLLLVIQMQDAVINSSNNTAYGANNGTGRGATALNSSGRFEYVVVTALVAGGVTVRGTGAGNGLLNTYTTAAFGTNGQKRFQVIRVPQYSSATLGSTLTAAAWDGSTGGVLAVDVAGTLALGSATVSVTGLGFRGGGGRPLAGQNQTDDADYRNTAARAAHGQKGEGIAGTPRYLYDATTNSVLDTTIDGYPNGSSARGAPGNAGGGGTDGNPSVNDENTGGGGGANGGDGGQGGDSWNSQEAVGGVGGDAVTYSTATPMALMGGGGGAGSRNNSSTVASSGGAGGGVVMIRAAAVSGSGTINANGAAAYNDTDNDGGGGGGGGGSVWVTVTTGSLAGLTVNARGGRGGNAWDNEPAGGDPGARHGPGGGGGGGFVAHTGGATVSVTGGAHGITTTSGTNSAYGSTDGATGQILSVTPTQVAGVSSGAQCVPVLTVTKTTSTATVSNGPSGTTASYSIVVSNTANRSAATQLSVSDTLPTGFTYASTTSVALAGGATRSPTTNPTAGAAVPAWGQFTIPGGASVTVNFTVAIAAGVNGTQQNPAAATYLDPQRTTPTGTATASYNSASSTNEDVNVVGPPSVTLVKDCTSPADCTTQSQLPGTELTYRIVFTNGGGRAAQNFVLTDAVPANTDFKLGSAAAALGTTGLTVSIVYSNNGGTTYVYTPVSGGGGAPAGYDRAVTHVRWVFTNNLSQTAPNNTGNVTFVTRIR
jgi:uncharacterized repeat protein (TIGR01451 family)/fimbrial isopeptide formation D2 family protein